MRRTLLVVLTLSLAVRQIKKIAECKHWNESTIFLRYCSQVLYKIFLSFAEFLEWNTIQSVTILMKATEQYFAVEV